MDIKPTVTRIGNEISTHSRPQQTADNKAAESSAGSGDSSAANLTLTDTAKNMLAMQSASGQVADVDMAKVEELRQSIEDGTYEVDSAKLADNLIQSSLELP